MARIDSIGRLMGTHPIRVRGTDDAEVLRRIMVLDGLLREALAELRFWRHVDRGSDPQVCWLWRGDHDQKGYGRIAVGGGKRKLAHRFSYELLVGPIPVGLQIDHVKARGCTSLACVNPAHLEPVTARENLLRSSGVTAKNANKTACHRGHAYTEENTEISRTGSRGCRTCRRATRLAAKLRKAS